MGGLRRTNRRLRLIVSSVFGPLLLVSAISAPNTAQGAADPSRPSHEPEDASRSEEAKERGANDIAGRYGVSPAEGRARIDRQQWYGDVTQDASRTFGPDYGGAGIANRERGQLVVFTTASDDRGERVRERARDPRYVEIRVVERSLDELIAILEGVLQEAGTTEDGRFAVEASVDVMRNLVVVRVPPSLDPDKRERIRRMDGVEIQEVTSLSEDDCTRTACAPPLRGGLRIPNSVGTYCSIGFNAKKGTGWIILTAGHCASATYNHNGTRIGVSGTRVDSGAVDAQWIPVDNPTYWKPTNWIRRDSSWSTIISGKMSYTSLYYDQYVCRVGGVTEDCGWINSTVGTGGNNYPVVEVWDMCANGGDSGGAVWDTGNGRAVGMHVSSSPSGDCPQFELSYFSSITEVESLLSVSILTTSQSW